MMRPWWFSYAEFEADESGLYPQPRQVVAHFRRLAGLDYGPLAQALGLGKKTVYYMERNGKGLDSLSRLRQLQSSLQIPAPLLGLCDSPAPAGSWWQDSYEPWPSSDDGWPDARLVVKSYRKHKNWTQSHLAQALNIDLRGVQAMEQSGSSLDSLSRRRALRYLLEIPPILLGLDSAHGPTSLLSVPALLSAVPDIRPSLSELQDAEQRLWTGYYTGHGQDELRNISPDLYHIKDTLISVPNEQRSAYLEHFSLLLQAAGNIVLARANTSEVVHIMNAGIKYARLSHDTGLLSTALGRRAAALLELGQVSQARKSILEALYVASPAEKVKRFPVACRVLSTLAQDRSDRHEIYEMLDAIVVNDRFKNGVDSNIILWCRAQSLLHMSENAPDKIHLLLQAEDLLIHAEVSAPNTPRRMLIIRLVQAQVYTGLHQYEYAATLAIEACELMKKLKSVLYLAPLLEIYRCLMSSSFATSPQVARLGLLLSGL